MLIKVIIGFLSIRVCTCKYVEKMSKNHVFICNMHGDYVVKYAILCYNQLGSLVLWKREKERLFEVVETSKLYTLAFVVSLFGRG